MKFSIGIAAPSLPPLHIGYYHYSVPSQHYIVEPTSKEVVAHLIKQHYLGKWPGVTTCILGLRQADRYIGVIVFALPPRETNKRYSVAASWEFARLFIEDHTPKNTETWFISRAIRYVKKNHPEIELLVSYADPSVGHSGTIYRAGSWIFDGFTDSGRKSPRCDLMVGEKRYSRWSHVPDGAIAVKVPRIRKRRFVYWLDGSHEKRRSMGRKSGK